MSTEDLKQKLITRFRDFDNLSAAYFAELTDNKPTIRLARAIGKSMADFATRTFNIVESEEQTIALIEAMRQFLIDFSVPTQEITGLKAERRGGVREAACPEGWEECRDGTCVQSQEECLPLP